MRFRRRKTPPRIPPRVLCERSYFRTARRRLFYALRSYLQNGQSLRRFAPHSLCVWRRTQFFPPTRGKVMFALRRCIKTFAAFVFCGKRARLPKTDLAACGKIPPSPFLQKARTFGRKQRKKRVVREQRHAHSVVILPIAAAKKTLFMQVYNGKILGGNTCNKTAIFLNVIDFVFVVLYN